MKTGEKKKRAGKELEKSEEKPPSVGGGYGGHRGLRGSSWRGTSAERSALGDVQYSGGKGELTQRVIQGGHAAGAFHR